MTSHLTEQVFAELATFSSDTRLYAFSLEGESADLGSGGLLVEAFTADEQLQGLGMRDVIVLSTSAQIALAPLLGRPASLEVSLADGTRTSFSGHISEAAMLGSNGGLARYRLRLVPWLWLLSQVRNSRVWQDSTVIEMVESVFGDYLPHARWRWSDDVGPFMAECPMRSYCCQYRESDFDFIHRLLTEEGLGWRFEEHDGGQRLVLFADSSALSAVPEDPGSAGGGGIRFHGARAVEHSDTVQALQAKRTLSVALATVLSYDYKARKIVSAGVPTRLSPGGKHAPALESYDSPGQYAYTNAAQAQRHAELQMQAHEARSALWQGSSTVRTLRPGTRFSLTQGPLQQRGATAPAYAVLRVTSVGVNNLPAVVMDGLAELFGPIPELLEDALRDIAPVDVERAIAEARRSGYANCFEAIDAGTPWRPVLAGSAARSHPRPTAAGSQSAIVVGADGSDRPNGADELYCDRLGRVRIRFHWQDSAASCWVRVAQRSAGGGMGSQFLPRIGQEVLVQFLEGDIDRPIIVGALYNGQGEGGVVPTPGGNSDRDSGSAVFAPARDHAVSAQGNLAGGNSPVWHGASAGSAGHRNSAAQWGVRSKEFGGAGYNQLLFDDTDGQGRIQLKSSHAASELNLGHLIHSADNYRGSFRGTGAELRTDGYGAVRAGAGLLISSYKVNHGAAARESAGDNAPGLALLKQALTLGERFSKAATTHETVAFASHLGAAKADSSVIDDKAAPLKALWTTAAGMLSKESLDAARADAGARNVDPAEDKLPHTSDPMIGIAAKAGLGVLAGQDLQFANGETIVLMSGNDTQFISGGQMRVHSGQAIGVLAGAVEAGDNNIGLQLIAARDPIDLQAQNDVLKVQARDEVNVVSANAHIDWAAAKSISLSTAGGANITIAGGNITVQCPGKILIRAGQKTFSGPARTDYLRPVLPHEDNTWVQLEAHYDDAWNTAWPLERLKFNVDGETIAKAVAVNPLKQGGK
jgi:type VI secretion system secreted protein VgrG